MMKKAGRLFFDWFGENKLYFMRGYQQYFQLPIGLVNNTGIVFYLIIAEITAFPTWFKFWMFASVYITLLTFFSWGTGKFDYNKGTFKTEQLTFAKQSPIWSELFANQKRIEERQKYLEEKLDKLLKLLLKRNGD